ncbi:MAG: hypothetical protein ABW139_02925 [Candidatus Thiodiazotropha sp. DIVDIV]
MRIKSIGFKVVDRRRDEIEPLLLRCQRELRPLEIGLYFNDPSSHDLIEQALPDKNVLLNTHIDHRRLNVFALDVYDTGPHLRRQIELSLKWGADYGINHLSAFPFPRREEAQTELHEKLSKQLSLLNSICREYQFPIYLENTYHELDLYRQTFRAIRENQFDYLHFCFDFGHAKIWSAKPLTDWLKFLEELKRDNKKIHFHLHTNRGLSDEHLSFIEAEWLDIIKADSYTSPMNSFEAIEQIDQQFPESRKLMEVPPQEAIENLRAVADEIDQIRRKRELLTA